MQGSVGQETARPADRFARGVKRHFLWLLVGCYGLAALWPGPGLAMRGWRWSPATVGETPITLPLLLLTLMLFSAAVLTDVRQIRTVLLHPTVLAVTLLAVWLGPAVLLVVAGWVVPWAVDGQATAGLLVGLALIAAMPVANSSVGWTHHANGNLAIGLTLVVLSISLCPWVTPWLLQLLGSSLSPRDQAYCQALVNEFSGVFFIVWVLLPTAAGFATRFVVSERRVEAMKNPITLLSAVALLLLNYLNSALALPKIHHIAPRLLVTTVVLAIALSVVGLVIGWTLARVLRLTDETRSALLFGLSMKHTGLALILAGAVLADQPLAILIIVLATLMQHFLAGLVGWWLLPAPGVGGAE